MSRKLFVGSLPHGIQDIQLRAEFSKYGLVEEVFIKQGCEVGRQWAFITMSNVESARLAKEATDQKLQFPGAERVSDVMEAKNQGMNGTPSSSVGAGAVAGGQAGSQGGARKVFVGSLPNHISEMDLSAEFGKYGTITEMHINNKPVEENRQWCFISYTRPDEAELAQKHLDRQVIFQGCDRPVEVQLARHQGLYGQEAIIEDPNVGAAGTVFATAAAGVMPAMPVAVSSGPRKIFVGSLPSPMAPEVLQEAFSKYGQIVELHVNSRPTENGRNFAFVTFATPEQAQQAKDGTDRVLQVAGADRPCEVMLAKNQGKQGTSPLPGAGLAAVAAPAPAHHLMHQVMQPFPMLQYAAPAAMGGMVHPPPPPVSPAPPTLTPWRMYKTASGLPYYHNHLNGVTQWECPPDLAPAAAIPAAPAGPPPAAAMAMYGAMPTIPTAAPVGYAPY